MVLDKILESPLDYKEIQPVHPKGDQSWVFIVRIDVEAETPILWPLGVKNCLGRLKVGGEGDDILRWLEGITDSMDMRLSMLNREAWHAAVHGVPKSQTRLQD